MCDYDYRQAENFRKALLVKVIEERSVSKLVSCVVAWPVACCRSPSVVDCYPRFDWIKYVVQSKLCAKV